MVQRMQSTSFNTVGQVAVRRPDKPNVQSAIDHGYRWLWNSYLPRSRGETVSAGWPQSPGKLELTVWGGTLDGIRALRLQNRDQPLEPRLRDALDWIRTQQVDCGGFDSCEIPYPAAETTAWMILMFGELSLDPSDPTVERAISYLLDCVAPSGGVTTTPTDREDQRVMPMALALWAFSKYREDLRRRGFEFVMSDIVERLKLIQDPESRGWGVSHGAVPNTATTAQVITALCASGVSPDEEYLQRATAFIVGRQEADGGWPNSYDESFSDSNPRRPYRCLNHTTSWALLALMNSVDHNAAARRACRAAARYLVERQTSDGGWLFEEYEDTKHVWLTAQIVIALNAWRSFQQGPNARPAAVAARDAVASGLTALRRNAFNVLLAALLAKQYLHIIVQTVGNAGHWLGIDRVDLANNLASSLIWAVCSLALALGLSRLRGQR